MLFRWLVVLEVFLLVACGGDTSSNVSAESQNGIKRDSSLSVDSFTLLMDADSIKTLLGSDRFKVVFRNEDVGNLVLLDYTGDSVKMTLLAQGMDVYHPTFSPDGNKVAFSSAFEGASFESKLYILDLRHPEDIDSLDVESAAIPRWYVMDDDTVIVYVDYSGDDRNERWSSSATWRVSYKGAKFGMPEEIYGRSYNGGLAYDFSFAATGASRLFFHKSEAEEFVYEDRYNDQQVCNVSVSRDSSKLISFLETAGFMGRDFTHDESGIWHRYVFYQDEDGKIVNAIKSFDGTTFEHVEWLDGSPVQVGILLTKAEYFYDIVLIDYVHSSVHKFIKSEGVSMWTPDLWVER